MGKAPGLSNSDWLTLCITYCEQTVQGESSLSCMRRWRTSFRPSPRTGSELARLRWRFLRLLVATLVARSIPVPGSRPSVEIVLSSWPPFNSASKASKRQYQGGDSTRQAYAPVSATQSHRSHGRDFAPDVANDGRHFLQKIRTAETRDARVPTLYQTSLRAGETFSSMRSIPVQCATQFCTYPATAASAAFARVTFDRMSDAVAVQMNGLGSMLC